MKTLKKGDTNEQVALICSKLQHMRYPIETTNIFNQSVKHYVTIFQKNNNLTPDGIVGYNTWEKLLFIDTPETDTLTDEDYKKTALLLNCEPAVIKAVQKVETAGFGGFVAPGKPTILFEGHVFWKQLKKIGIDPLKYSNTNPTILYQTWKTTYYKGGKAEYKRLEAARKINPTAADASASWGMFQIMGCNYALCDQPSVEAFVQRMCQSERQQLLLFARFIKNARMLPALQAKDWKRFAKQYNGTAYAKNKYDKKLEKQYHIFTSK